MGVPLKVSAGLFAAAKREAEATDRSITAQVEHWANIGRSAEAELTHAELLSLKALGEILGPVSPSPARRRKIHAILERAVRRADSRKVIVEIRRAGNAVYSADPDRPGRLIRALPDGRRERGRLVGRRFVPDEPSGAD